MRQILMLAAGLALVGCNNTPRFDAVSIRPIYGWTDGCQTARISGHGFSDNVTVKIGANTMEAAEAPATPKDIDKGFWFERRIPAGSYGFADVVVDNGDGQVDTIPKAYYYTECPGIAVDSLAEEVDGVVATGDTITIRGCGLASTLKAQVGDPDQDGDGNPDNPPVALTQTCGAGVATFAAPNLPAGDYLVSIVDGTTGALVYPPLCDTADTATACVQLPVTYGSL